MKAVLLVAILGLTGCATQPRDVNPPSYLSASLGSNMDITDHARANEVLESGSEDRSVSWVNPRTGKRFTVTPTKTFKKGYDDCRSWTAVYGGRSVSGDACRLENGLWLFRY